MAAGVKSTGEVFTQGWVASWILDLVGYDPSTDLTAKILVEPSCGDGAFLVPAVERLIASAKKYEVDFADLGGAICAVDISPDLVEAARTRTALLLTGLGVPEGTKLAEAWIQQGDYLLDDTIDEADFIVGNPPYVRLENIDPAVASAYRSSSSVMNARSDIYIGFIEKALDALSEGGVLSFICADRWMRNQYGRKLRNLITGGGFHVTANIKLHDVECFEKEVSAYPAITVIERTGQPNGSVIINTQAGFNPLDVPEVKKFITNSRQTQTASRWNGSKLTNWFRTDMWPEGTPEELAQLQWLETNFDELEDDHKQTKVGIGVATGADKIYITSDNDLIERERALPLVLAKHIRTGQICWDDNPQYLVNPWNEAGLVDISKYPKFEQYFTSHSDQIMGRHVARKTPSKWFRTIDRVDMSLVEKPKILLADMGKRIMPVVDEGNFYPHHNLYWITSTVWPINSLAGLLMSDIANLFISAYSVKMRGGTLRFQAQYLRKICVPNIENIDSRVLTVLADAYAERNLDTINELAEHVYKQTPENLSEAV